MDECLRPVQSILYIKMSSGYVLRVIWYGISSPHYLYITGFIVVILPYQRSISPSSLGGSSETRVPKTQHVGNTTERELTTFWSSITLIKHSRITIGKHNSRFF